MINKRALLFAIFTLFLCYSCSKYLKLNEDFDYNKLKERLKKNGFDKMSVDEKAFFKQTLIEKLKSDSDYAKFNRISDIQTLAVLNSNSTPGQTFSNQNPHTDSEWITYYKEEGLKDPAGYLELKKEKRREFSVVIHKYPELLFLDKDTGTEVFTNSKKKTTFKFTPH